MLALARPDTPVLVVEDEADLRALLVGLLRADGYVAEGATDGADALRLLRDERLRPCLILLDLLMPRMNGWAFRAAQRRDPELADIPVIVVTGYAQELESHPALGAVATLAKPFDLDALLAAVDRCCKRSNVVS